MSKPQKDRSEPMANPQPEATADFPIVGIGASAGGLEALVSFFKKMPMDSGMAFVVIQHLSPDYKSLMNELLARHTSMPIHLAANRMPVLPNNVYLIPPRKSLTIDKQVLVLNDTASVSGISLPIDIFFRSLAVNSGSRSIGIILSGTGSDGTMGIRAIKEAGGMVMAQDDASAKFDGMPRSSIATGMVDFVTSPEKMPDTLLSYINHPYTAKNSVNTTESGPQESTLIRILSLIRDQYAVDFTFYKSNTVTRRIDKRIGINQLGSLEEYLSFLESSPVEIKTLYKDLLIGVTQFFRDREAFELLNDQLPKVFENNSEDLLRIWCVGCSTGEEAYSIAILLNEIREKMGYRHQIKVFATDLDVEHIEIAGVGLYPESIVSDVPAELLRKYFIIQPGGYRVKESLRKMIVFAKQNITRDPPFSKLDLISCRNMLIYLNADIQRKIIGGFYYSLTDQGLLFLGSSESLGDHQRGFKSISNKWKLFLKVPGYHPVSETSLLIPDYTHRKSNALDYSWNRTGAPVMNYRMGESVLIDLLNEYLTSSVIINEDLSIVHIFGEINDFIRFSPGKAHLDILHMVSSELSVVLSSMLNKANKDNKSLVFKEIKLKGYDKPLTIRTRPLIDGFSKNRYTLVSFSFAEDRLPENSSPSVADFNLNQELAERYNQLERDLQFSKENLQATVEELETSNEELQSTNEELIASNEELQSTNEELQSVNEELFTVNSEYQSKIEELSILNNDMNNLLKNTNIGVLFLDQRLVIRKFTPSFGRIVNIMDMDIGRPIADLNMLVDYPDFQHDLRTVLTRLQELERELCDSDGNWMLLRIRPYRNENNAIDGLAITVVDINRIKESEDKYRFLFKNLTQGVVYQNKKGEIIDCNPAAEEILGLSFNEMTGRTSADPRWKAVMEDGRDFPGDKHPSMIALKTRKEVSDVTMGVYHPKHESYRWIRIHAKPILDPEQKHPVLVFTTFEDITRQKEEKDHRQLTEDLFYRILEHSPLGKTVLDKTGKISYANQKAADILGVDPETILKRHYNDIQWQVSDPEGNPIPDDYLPFSLILSGQQRIKNYLLHIITKDGEKRLIAVNGSPMYDRDGQVDGAVLSLENLEDGGRNNTVSWKDFQ